MKIGRFLRFLSVFMVVSIFGFGHAFAWISGDCNQPNSNAGIADDFCPDGCYGDGSKCDSCEYNARVTQDGETIIFAESKAPYNRTMDNCFAACDSKQFKKDTSCNVFNKFSAADEYLQISLFTTFLGPQKQLSFYGDYAQGIHMCDHANEYCPMYYNVAVSSNGTIADTLERTNEIKFYEGDTQLDQNRDIYISKSQKSGSSSTNLVWAHYMGSGQLVSNKPVIFYPTDSAPVPTNPGRYDDDYYDHNFQTSYVAKNSSMLGNTYPLTSTGATPNVNAVYNSGSPVTDLHLRGKEVTVSYKCDRNSAVISNVSDTARYLVEFEPSAGNLAYFDNGNCTGHTNEVLTGFKVTGQNCDDNGQTHDPRNSWKWGCWDNATLVAQWEDSTTTHAVTYRCGSTSQGSVAGAGETDSTGATAGQPYAVKDLAWSNCVQPTGYEFQGWSADNGGTSYVYGESIPYADLEASSFELTAMWRPACNAIVFDDTTNGGTSTDGGNNNRYRKKSGETGWYTDSKCDGDPISNANVTVYVPIKTNAIFTGYYYNNTQIFDENGALTADGAAWVTYGVNDTLVAQYECMAPYYHQDPNNPNTCTACGSDEYWDDGSCKSCATYAGSTYSYSQPPFNWSIDQCFAECATTTCNTYSDTSSLPGVSKTVIQGPHSGRQIKFYGDRNEATSSCNPGTFSSNYCPYGIVYITCDGDYCPHLRNKQTTFQDANNNTLGNRDIVGFASKNSNDVWNFTDSNNAKFVWTAPVGPAQLYQSTAGNYTTHIVYPSDAAPLPTNLTRFAGYTDTLGGTNIRVAYDSNSGTAALTGTNAYSMIHNVSAAVSGTSPLYTKYNDPTLTCSITYDCMDGGASVTYSSIPEGDTHLIQPYTICYRNGYTVTAWTSNDFSPTTPSTAVTCGPTTQNITFEAVRVGNTIDIDWNENGGNNITNGTCTYGGTFILPTLAQATYPNNTHEFNGWENTYNGTIRGAGANMSCHHNNLNVYDGISSVFKALWCEKCPANFEHGTCSLNATATLGTCAYSISCDAGYEYQASDDPREPGTCVDNGNNRLTYETNGGTLQSGVSNPRNYTPGTLTVNETATRSHSSFVGWCTDAGLTNCGKPLVIDDASGPITVYAKWSCDTGYHLTSNECAANIIYLTYETATGTTVPSPYATQCTYGSTFNMPSAPTGLSATQTFNGYKVKNYDTITYNAGATVNCNRATLGVYENTQNTQVVIEAQITTAGKSVVYYDCNDDNDLTVGDEAIQGSSYTVQTPTQIGCSKAGHTFSGWTFSGNSQAYSACGSNDCGQVSPYTWTTLQVFAASWNPGCYAVTFDDHNGTGGSQGTTLYKLAAPGEASNWGWYTDPDCKASALSGNISTPTGPEGRPFNGYYTTTSDGTKVFTNAGAINTSVVSSWYPTSATTLHAQYGPKPGITVIYDCNGRGNRTIRNGTAHLNESFEPADPSGCNVTDDSVFAGWLISDTNTYVTTRAFQWTYSTTKTLTAQWCDACPNYGDNDGVYACETPVAQTTTSSGVTTMNGQCDYNIRCNTGWTGGGASVGTSAPAAPCTRTWNGNCPQQPKDGVCPDGCYGSGNTCNSCSLDASIDGYYFPNSAYGFNTTIANCYSTCERKQYGDDTYCDSDEDNVFSNSALFPNGDGEQIKDQYYQISFYGDYSQGINMCEHDGEYCPRFYADSDSSTVSVSKTNEINFYELNNALGSERNIYVNKAVRSGNSTYLWAQYPGSGQLVNKSGVNEPLMFYPTNAAPAPQSTALYGDYYDKTGNAYNQSRVAKGSGNPLWSFTSANAQSVYDNSINNLYLRGTDVTVNYKCDADDNNVISGVSSTAYYLESFWPDGTTETSISNACSGAHAGQPLMGYIVEERATGTCDNNGEAYNGTWGCWRDAILVAQWGPACVEVSFNDQGGTGGNSSTKLYKLQGDNRWFTSGCRTEWTGHLNNPQKTNYVFQGYYTAASGGDRVFDNTTPPTPTTYGNAWTTNADTTLYAQWKPECVEVVFDDTTNGGNSAGNTGLYKAIDDSKWYSDNKCETVWNESNPAVVAPTHPLAQNGVAFTGYYTTAATGGTEVFNTTPALTTSGRTWTITSPNQAKLYARYSGVTHYNITYKMRGGIWPDAPNQPNCPGDAGCTTSYVPGVGTTVDVTPSRANSEFLGWCKWDGNYQGRDGMGTLGCADTPQLTYTIGTNAAEDIVLLANWGCLPMYHQNPTATEDQTTPSESYYTCVACRDDEYWDADNETCASCDTDTNHDYPYSKSPYNWSKAQCFKECDRSCDIASSDLFSSLMVNNVLIVHDENNRKMSAFYGNRDAYSANGTMYDVCSSNLVQYCPYGIGYLSCSTGECPDLAPKSFVFNDNDNTTELGKINIVSLAEYENNTYEFTSTGNTALMWSHYGPAQTVALTDLGGTGIKDLVRIVYPAGQAPLPTSSETFPTELLAGYRTSTSDTSANIARAGQALPLTRANAVSIVSETNDGTAYTTTDRDLYPLYNEPDSYTITFHMHGGTAATFTAPENVSCSGDTCTVTVTAHSDFAVNFEPDPKRVETYNGISYENWAVFQGWCDSDYNSQTGWSGASCHTEPYTIQDITSNQHLYARFDCEHPSHPQPGHEADVCTVCQSGEYWNGTSCELCSDAGSEWTSVAPWNWSKRQCFKECSWSCQTRSNYGTQFPNANNKQLSFYGNVYPNEFTGLGFNNYEAYDVCAHQGEPEVQYCPYIADYSVYNAMKPMSASIKFNSGDPTSYKTTRYVVGTREDSSSIKVLAGSNPKWSYIAGPGQQSNPLCFNGGEQASDWPCTGTQQRYTYTSIVYPTTVLPEPEEVAGNNYTGYWTSATGGSRTIAPTDTALNSSNAGGVFNGLGPVYVNTERDIYAQYTESATHDIIFHLNGSQVKIGGNWETDGLYEQTVNAGDAFSLSSEYFDPNVLRRDLDPESGNYVEYRSRLTGWCTNANLTGTCYTDPTTISNVHTDVHLYARWECVAGSHADPDNPLGACTVCLSNYWWNGQQCESCPAASFPYSMSGFNWSIKQCFNTCANNRSCERPSGGGYVRFKINQTEINKQIMFYGHTEAERARACEEYVSDNDHGRAKLCAAGLNLASGNVNMPRSKALTFHYDTVNNEDDVYYIIGEGSGPVGNPTMQSNGALFWSVIDNADVQHDSADYVLIGYPTDKAPAAHLADGHTYSAYYANQNGTGTSYVGSNLNLSRNIANNLLSDNKDELWPGYTNTAYDIEYVVQGGVSTQGQCPANHTYGTATDVSGCSTQRNHSTFLGWCLLDGATISGDCTPMSPQEVPANYAPANGTTVYLGEKWGCVAGYHVDGNDCKPNIIYLTYNTLTGTTLPAERTTQCTYDDTFNMPSAPTGLDPATQTFNGWTVENHDTYDPGDPVNCNQAALGVTLNSLANPVNINADINTSGTFTVRYVCNDDNLITKSDTAIEDHLYTIRTVTWAGCSKRGKVFAGWKFSGDDNTYNSCTSTSCGDIQEWTFGTNQTFTAVWSDAASCSFSYDCGDHAAVKPRATTSFRVYVNDATPTHTVQSVSDVCNVDAGWVSATWENGTAGDVLTCTANTGDMTFTPRFSPTVTCPCGQYIPANKTECVECPAGSYCEGGEFTVPSASDQGKNPCRKVCTDEDITSEAGACSIDQCYQPCRKDCFWPNGNCIEGPCSYNSDTVPGINYLGTDGSCNDTCDAYVYQPDNNEQNWCSVTYNCNVIIFDDNNAGNTNVNANSRLRKTTDETLFKGPHETYQNECDKGISNPTANKPQNDHAIFMGYYTERTLGQGDKIFDSNCPNNLCPPTTYGANSWTINADTKLYAQWDCEPGYVWNDANHACEDDTVKVQYMCYAGANNTAVEDDASVNDYTVRTLSWYQNLLPQQCNIDSNDFSKWLFSGDDDLYNPGEHIYNLSANQTFIPGYTATFDCETDHWTGTSTTQNVALGSTIQQTPAMSCQAKSGFEGCVNPDSEWKSSYASTLTSPVPNAQCTAGDVSVAGGDSFTWACPTSLTFTPDDALIDISVDVYCTDPSQSVTLTFDCGDPDIGDEVEATLLSLCSGGPCEVPDGTHYAHGYLSICADNWGDLDPTTLEGVEGPDDVPGCYKTTPGGGFLFDFSQLDPYWNQIENLHVSGRWRCPQWVKYKCNADDEERYEETMAYAAYYGEEYTVLGSDTVGCQGYGYNFDKWVKEGSNDEYDENETVNSWPYEEAVTLVAQWDECEEGYYWDETTGECLRCDANAAGFPLSKPPYNWSINQCYRECPGVTCTNTTDTALPQYYSLQKFDNSNNQIEFYGNANLNTCSTVTYCPYVINGGDVYATKTRGVPVNFMDNTDTTVDTYHVVGMVAISNPHDVGTAFLWSQIAGLGQKYDFEVSNTAYTSVPIVYPVYSAPYTELSGFTFTGYYNPRVNGTQYVQADAALNQTNADNVVDNIVAAADLSRDLYANYGTNTYNIVYEEHGGNSVDGTTYCPSTHTYESATNVSGCVTQRANSTFLGWCLDEISANCTTVQEIPASYAPASGNTIYLHAKYECVEPYHPDPTQPLEACSACASGQYWNGFSCVGCPSGWTSYAPFNWSDAQCFKTCSTNKDCDVYSTGTVGGYDFTPFGDTNNNPLTKQIYFYGDKDDTALVNRVCGTDTPATYCPAGVAPNAENVPMPRAVNVDFHKKHDGTNIETYHITGEGTANTGNLAMLNGVIWNAVMGTAQKYSDATPYGYALIAYPTDFGPEADEYYGYDFAGYYNAQTGGNLRVGTNLVLNQTNANSVAMDSNATGEQRDLYARYDINNYDFDYYCNGHTGSAPDGQTNVPFGNPYTVQGRGGCQEEGHEFQGWNVKVDGALLPDVLYAADSLPAEFNWDTPTPSDKKYHFVAKWDSDPIYYTLQYSCNTDNGGLGNPPGTQYNISWNQDVEASDNIIHTVEPNENYCYHRECEVNKWAVSGTSEFKNLGEHFNWQYSDRVKTFTANWDDPTTCEKRKYGFIYNCAGHGEGAQTERIYEWNNTPSYSVENAAAANCQWPGHEFLGWKLKVNNVMSTEVLYPTPLPRNFDWNSLTNQQVPANGWFTFVADWDENLTEYNFTYRCGDGHGDDITDSNITYGDPYTVRGWEDANCTLQGRTFLHWKLTVDNTVTGAVNPGAFDWTAQSTPSAPGYTYYLDAQWSEPNKFDLSYDCNRAAGGLGQNPDGETGIEWGDNITTSDNIRPTDNTPYCYHAVCELENWADNDGALKGLNTQFAWNYNNDQTFKADWPANCTKRKYTFKYDCGGHPGTPPAGQTGLEYGDYYMVKNNTLADCNPQGRGFRGWYVNGSTDVLYPDNGETLPTQFVWDRQPIPADATYTFEAAWGDPIPVNLSYDCNRAAGGFGDMEPPTQRNITWGQQVTSSNNIIPGTNRKYCKHRICELENWADNDETLIGLGTQFEWEYNTDQTFTADWPENCTRNLYGFKYDCAGHGDGRQTGKTYIWNDTYNVETRGNCQWLGHEFLGWKLRVNETTTQDVVYPAESLQSPFDWANLTDDQVPEDGWFTFVAEWGNQIDYTITYKPSAGNGEEIQRTVHYGDRFTTLTPNGASFSKPGSKMIGWEDDTTDPNATKFEGIGVEYTYNREYNTGLTAIWSECPTGTHPNDTYTECVPDVYHYTYDCGEDHTNGVMLSTYNVQYGTTIQVKSPNDVAIQCSDNGHKFSHWQLRKPDVNGNVVVNEVAPGEFAWEIDGEHGDDYVFVAMWDGPNEYTITYTKGDANGENVIQTVTYHQPFTTYDNSDGNGGGHFSMENSKIVGWSNHSDPSEVYGLGITYGSYNHIGNIILDAMWVTCQDGYQPNAMYTACVPETYHYVYDCGEAGGTPPAGGDIQFDDEIVIASADSCNDIGYQFMHWQLMKGDQVLHCEGGNGSCNVHPDDIYQWKIDGNDGDIYTFKAIWGEPKDYKITYTPGENADGDNEEQTVTYTQPFTTYTNAQTEFTRAGWIVTRWNNLTEPNRYTELGHTYDAYDTVGNTMMEAVWQICPANTYQSGDACVPCGDGEWSNPGSTACQKEVYHYTYNCGEGHTSAVNPAVIYDVHYHDTIQVKGPNDNAIQCSDNGWAFDHWKLVRGSSIVTASVAQGEEYYWIDDGNDGDNYTFVAIWSTTTGNKYDVIYTHGDGATGGPAVQHDVEYWHDFTTYTSAETPFNRPGYGIVSWQNSTEQGKYTGLGQTYRYETVGNTTLVAQWQMCGEGTYSDNGACEPCPEGQTSSPGSTNVNQCFPTTIECEAANATRATRTWINAKREYGKCTVEECEDGYHISANVCVLNDGACTVPHGHGMRDWNGATWGECQVEACDPGYEIFGNACVECYNRRDNNGDIAVSTYAQGCEIAACMYQGQKYALNGDTCELICEQRSDESGEMRWDASRNKCIRTCKPGYKMW